jgi:hypothetical protein
MSLQALITPYTYIYIYGVLGAEILMISLMQRATSSLTSLSLQSQQIHEHQ